MARTPNETVIEQHIVTDADTPGLPAMKAALDTQAIVTQEVEDKINVIKAVGRIESAVFFGKISKKLLVETALAVKNNKEYKGLPFPSDYQGEKKTEVISTFDEFCDAYLGKTSRHIRTLIKNYQTVGAELYEQAQALGFRQVDYDALKALPEDDKKLVLMAVEANDGDKAIELLQEMAVKHANEKAALSEQAETLRRDLDAKDELLAKKDEKINQLDQKLTRKFLDNQDKPVGWEEMDALTRQSETLSINIAVELRRIILALFDVSDEDSLPGRQLAAAQAVARVMAACDQLTEELNLNTQFAFSADSPARQAANMVDDWLTDDDPAGEGA
jgi:hypothetical protein